MQGETVKRTGKASVSRYSIAGPDPDIADEKPEEQIFAIIVYFKIFKEPPEPPVSANNDIPQITRVTPAKESPAPPGPATRLPTEGSPMGQNVFPG
jgi:hypothetical protein